MTTTNDDIDIEMEEYFRKEMKTWAYNEVKRKFYDKFQCYGFLQKHWLETENKFYYTYDLDIYKKVCPNCIVFSN